MMVSTQSLLPWLFRVDQQEDKKKKEEDEKKKKAEVRLPSKYLSKYACVGEEARASVDPLIRSCASMHATDATTPPRHLSPPQAEQKKKEKEAADKKKEAEKKKKEAKQAADKAKKEEEKRQRVRAPPRTHYR